LNLESELKTAIEAVKKACRICIKVQSSLVSEETITKKDKSPVTVADFGVQAVICHELNKAFPGYPIVGEEDSAELRTEAGKPVSAKVLEYVNTELVDLSEEQVLSAIDSGNHSGGSSGRFWTIDPIDGTKGFLRGDQYAVALALIENGQVVLGVLGCPNLLVDLNNPDAGSGCILSAIRGHGASTQLLDGESGSGINVSEITDPKYAPFCESVESAHSSHGVAEQIARLLGVTAPPIRIDSQCKYAVLARGDASIYLRLPTRKDYEEKIWDHAAGAIVVEEAGGGVTDIYGIPLDFSQGRTLSQNKGVVGSNGKFHEEIIAAVKEVLKDK